jgi:hypothetical protein
LLQDIREGKTTLFLDVMGIKVTRPKRKEFGPFKTYTRTIRSEFFGGEVLEVECTGAIQKYIKLRSVTSLKPVIQPKPLNWSTPKISKGTSESRDDPQDTVSCERCEDSFPKSDTGATGMVQTPHGTFRFCVDCAKKFI